MKERYAASSSGVTGNSARAARLSRRLLTGMTAPPAAWLAELFFRPDWPAVWVEANMQLVEVGNDVVPNPMPCSLGDRSGRLFRKTERRQIVEEVMAALHVHRPRPRFVGPASI